MDVVSFDKKTLLDIIKKTTGDTPSSAESKLLPKKYFDASSKDPIQVYN